MLQQSIQTDAADIIWREATFIAQSGWGRDSSPDLAMAACWAVHGQICRPRDLTPIESAHAAEVLDLIEELTGMTIPQLEAKHASSSTGAVVIELTKVAWHARQVMQAALRD